MIEAVGRKKHGWLPILTVLFLISYGLMTMLIVEQGQTIESQRALIKELFRDSTELSAARMKAHESAPAAQTQASVPQNPSLQHPSAQAPAKQAPSTQADSQVRPQHPTAKTKSFRMPSRPASDLENIARTLITI
jgi:hypothetical protein